MLNLPPLKTRSVYLDIGLKNSFKMSKLPKKPPGPFEFFPPEAASNGKSPMVSFCGWKWGPFLSICFYEFYKPEKGQKSVGAWYGEEKKVS